MHDCTECGGACYCHGDIDDCEVEDPHYAFMNCTGCGCAADDIDDGDFFDDMELNVADIPPPNGESNADDSSKSE